MDRIKKIAVIGNYLPRMCGIATFTTDLVNSLNSVNEDISCYAIAMNDRKEGYKYPPKVKFEISQNIIKEYSLASDFLNISRVDVVCLQHEYGIFGGEAGNYIIQLIKELRMPVVTTLHTVLKKPTKEQKRTLTEIIKYSDKVVVMANKAYEFLKDIYQIPEEKIAFIHHGIPDMPFVDSNFYKDQFGVEGKKVILTFGLLSENKGLEFMINALPSIIEKYSDVVYIILGVTHPHVIKTNGEEYRLSLELLARNNKVDKNIFFYNRFVDIKELCEFLGACDIYVTPYLNESQIVSGTLAYSLGVGKATVSTPYWYAEEMMGKDRGVLVPFKDSPALAKAIIHLLDNEIEKNAMRKRAYTFSRNFTWPQVANDYIALFNEVKANRKERHYISISKAIDNKKASLPEIKLDHLYTLTDDGTGILQHAVFSIPNYSHGYCIDDNARALIVAVMGQRLLPANKKLIFLQRRYLSFIKYAYNEDNGYFRNFMSYDRRWLEDKGTDDSQGRTIWGLGVCCALSNDDGSVMLCTNLFQKALQNVQNLDLNHPRAISFALVGIHAYLAKYSGDTEARRVREILSERLYTIFKKNWHPDWPWHDDKVSYANAKIPQAFLLSGQWLQKPEMTDMGFTVLNWLIEKQTEDNHFSPIGNDGWLVKDREKARFDQQPIEAQAMIETCLLAYQMTNDEKYSDTAYKTFYWFLGQNDLGVPLYDYKTSGCKDGLQANGPNLNQGAESTLAWLISLMSMHGFIAEQKKLNYVEEIDE